MLEHNSTACMYLPWIGTAAALAFAVYVTMRSRRDSNLVNRRVKKEIAKIVDTFDIEDLDKKIIFCRCWRSAKFPYCDGSHNKFNDETGDNVGPLIIQKKGA